MQGQLLHHTDAFEEKLQKDMNSVNMHINIFPPRISLEGWQLNTSKDQSFY
jgi:hypothetical protein